MRPRLLFAAVAGLLACGFLSAADPAPTAAVFKFPLPVQKVPPAPLPVDVGTVPVLGSDVLYVIPSDLPFLLFDSPPGKVKVTRTVGPLTMFGKFLDKPGEDAELRTFTQKHIAIVQGIKGQTGRVELIAVPAGIQDEKGAVRQLIDLGAAPPPPKPDEPPPPPKPTPDSELRKLLAAAWALEDTGTNEQLAKLSGAFRASAKKAVDPGIISRKQLAAEANKLGNLAVTSDGLLKLRRAAGDWLNKTVGQSDVALDDDIRRQYVDAYTAVADAIDTLK